jgi:hypothetical protein
MDLFDNKSVDWKTFEEKIEEAVNLVENLKKKNRELTEKNIRLKEENRTFNEMKRKMEIKIKELLEKLSAIKE